MDSNINTSLSNFCWQALAACNRTKKKVIVAYRNIFLQHHKAGRKQIDLIISRKKQRNKK